MRTTVTIEKKTLDELIEQTGLKSKAYATRVAIDEYLKRRKIERIKNMKGKLEFDKNTAELRHHER